MECFLEANSKVHEKHLIEKYQIYMYSLVAKSIEESVQRHIAKDLQNRSEQKMKVGTKNRNFTFYL